MNLTNQECKTILTKIKNLSSIKLYLYIRGYEEKQANFSITYGELHKSLKISQTQLTTCLKELVEFGLLVKDGREYKSTHSYITGEVNNSELPDVVLKKLSVDELFEIECEEGSSYEDRIIKIIVEKCQEQEAELVDELLEIAHRYNGISLYGASVLYHAMLKSGVEKEDFFNMLDVQVKLGKEPAKLHKEYESMFDDVLLDLFVDKANKLIEYAKAEMAKLQVEADERGITLEEIVAEREQSSTGVK